MLEPGDRVRIDGGERTWTIAKVVQRAEVVTRQKSLSSSKTVNYYKLEDWPDDTMIPGDRISGVVGWTAAPGRP